MDTFKYNNRWLERGTEFSVHGVSGRFKFFAYNERDHSVTCYGGKQGHGMWRSFKVDRIKRIHWKPKMR